MSHNLTGKDKAARIPLGYHRIVRANRRKWALVSVVALLLVAGVVLATGYWKTWAAPLRPVHSAHAAWETECSACHSTLTPTTSGNPIGAMFGHGTASSSGDSSGG